MKQLLFLSFFVLLSACHSHPHDAQDDGPVAADRPALSFTNWTSESELFIELPALVKGKESPAAAHVTKLASFAPLSAGQVSVVVRGPGGDERFESQGPTVPGIFRPVAKPGSAGKRRLILEVRAEGLSVDHDLGEVTVYENVEAARAAVPEEPGTPGRITFLKEQQWPIEFRTAALGERSIRSTLRAPGWIRARSDGDLNVTAPVAGRVATTGRRFPLMGERVAANDLLGLLAPRLEAADLASLELAVTSAGLELRFAERERDRLQGLLNEGAVPQRRAEDAVRAADEAKASLTAAERRLDQFRRIDRTAGRGEGTVQLRAPLSGTVTAVQVAPGTFVEAGDPLFRVTDLTQLWLEVRVPAAEMGQLAEPKGAIFSVDGFHELFELPIESLVARGQVIDPDSQSVSVVFAVDNASARLPVGAFCRVFLETGDERRSLAVPETAVVDDGGTAVVFVQVEGEAFERRIVRLGARTRGYAEVLSGLRSGDHVVTQGAWSVKLAASSGAVPAHGHAH